MYSTELPSYGCGFPYLFLFIVENTVVSCYRKDQDAVHKLDGTGKISRFCAPQWRIYYARQQCLLASPLNEKLKLINIVRLIKTTSRSRTSAAAPTLFFFDRVLFAVNVSSYSDGDFLTFCNVA